MPYKHQRNYENFQIEQYEGVGKYGIPPLDKVDDSIVDELKECDFIGFNSALSEKRPAEKGLHFFLDDYQFMRLWRNPTRYIDLLSKFKYVLTPDFSLYTDFPAAMGLYNHYRKHWLGRYYQENGVKIIPTICWGDEETWEWCFDGEPLNSVVAVSSVGVNMREADKQLFIKGFEEMERRLRPTAILFFGKPIPELETELPRNIIYLETEQEKRLKVLRRG